MNAKEVDAITQEARILDAQVEVLLFGGNSKFVPYYSASKTLAHNLRPHMRERGYIYRAADVSLLVGRECHQVMFIHHENYELSFTAESDTEEMAICKAIVGVLGLEGNGEEEHDS